MDNFIEDLDERYQKERKKNRIKKENRAFVCNLPVKVNIYDSVNQNYMIRKGRLTKFLYIKGGCKVYFTDADILMMLLQIQEKSIMDLLLENLKKAYGNHTEKYVISIGKKEYQVDGISQIKSQQILTNPQDIDISFDELLVLINLILSKDQASNPLWVAKPDFFKHTLSKYILLLKFYYYRDCKAKEYLVNMGYNIDADIYSNDRIQARQDEKKDYFSNFKLFEKSGVL